MNISIPYGVGATEKEKQYKFVLEKINGLLDQEDDWITAMATISCELHHSFEYFHWTGFYRVVSTELLKIGPYQGGHGCLIIPFSKGVCGAAARTARTQLVDDVEDFPGHIACSSSTRSEIVVPITDNKGQVVAVLDLDSDHEAAFDAIDQKYLEELSSYLSQQFFSSKN